MPVFILLYDMLIALNLSHHAATAMETFYFFVGCTHLCCGPAPEGLFLEHGSDPGRIAAHCTVSFNESDWHEHNIVHC